jgi:heterodisulfide reductase subunit A
VEREAETRDSSGVDLRRLGTLEEKRRIGVYICGCATTIAGSVDVDELREFAGQLPSVVVARSCDAGCSERGQNIIKKDIRNLRLDRVVVAACSPHMHGTTFKRACREAGLNPYLLQIANIREQCSWVHRNGNAEKAKALVEAAVRRAHYLEPLQSREVSVNPNVLVIGGGIAGIQAALRIADSGHEVYLVEREPSIGGRMMQLDRIFPTLEDSSHILTPKMAAVGCHPCIQLMTYSEIVGVFGHVGNFRVKIRRKARHVDETKCTGCGICIVNCPLRGPSEFNLGLSKRRVIYTTFPQAVPNIPVIDRDRCLYFDRGTCRVCERLCEFGAIDFDQQERIEEVEVGAIIVATGYDLFDPAPMTQYGYRRLDNVVTSLEFERMCSTTGPTGGEIRLNDGAAPERVGIVHCVGSRDRNYFDYCSRVCCTDALKYSLLIKEKTKANVYQFYIDMQCCGKGFEEFHRHTSAQGTNFVRGEVAEVTDQAIAAQEEGKLIVVAEETLLGKAIRIPVDMVILCPAMKPRSDTAEVARLLGLDRRTDGFFLQRQPEVEPIGTSRDGVFVVGCAQGPKDITDTVAQASAAAAEVLAMMNGGRVEIEATSAVVDESLCSGCKVCPAVCPYDAISFVDEKKVCQISDVLCKGCGLCAAACPAGAISAGQFTDKQILAEIEGLLANVKPPSVAVQSERRGPRGS